MEPVKPGRGGVDKAKAGTTLADLKLKIAEFLININQDNHRPDEVYRIMAETKVGARKRTDLAEKLRVVFSVS